MDTAIFAILISSVNIIWTIITIPFQIVGLRLYKIAQQQKVATATTKLSKRGSMIEDGNPKGFIWGFPYLGYVHEITSQTQSGSINKSEIYILTTKSFYESIINNHDDNIKREKIKSYYRYGNYFWLQYDSKDIDVTDYEPFDHQTDAIRKIKRHFKSNPNKFKKNRHNTVCYLYGEPNSCKSTIPLLLAKKLKGSVCDSWNPTDPGDSLDLIYNKVIPTFDNPLIMILEEVDIIIEKIHKGITSHKHIPISVTNKIEWNTLLDKIDRGMYPNMILIMTSNKNDHHL